MQSVSYSPADLWVVREDDLVVSGIDLVNGAVGIAGPDVDGMVMSDEMFAYRVKDPSVASAVYLQLILRSEAARELLAGMSTGTSNRTRQESAEMLLELPVPPLVPIEEQRRIAGTFAQSIIARRQADSYQRDAEGTVAAAWPKSESRNSYPAAPVMR
jgi:restriction endonuclease S subunit